MRYAVIELKPDGTEVVTGYKTGAFKPEQIRTLSNGRKMLRPVELAKRLKATATEKVTGPHQEILPGKVRQFWLLVAKSAEERAADAERKRASNKTLRVDLDDIAKPVAALEAQAAAAK